MKRKFTDGWLNGQKAMGLYWDTATVLGLRVNKRSEMFIVQARGPAGSKRRNVGVHGDITYHEAQKLAPDIIKEIEDGTPAPAATPSRMTLQQAWELYQRDNILNPKTVATYQVSVDHAPWLDKPVASITREMVRKRMSELKNMPRTANKFVTVIGQIIRHVHLDLGIPVPTEGIKPYPVQRKKCEIRSDGDIATIYDEAIRWRNQTVGNVIRLLMFTGGIRLEQACTLRWQDVDFQRRSMSFKSQKGKSITLPMEPIHREILMEQRAISRELEERRAAYVFPCRDAKRKHPHITEVKDFWAHIEKALGYKGVRSHDLRRFYNPKVARIPGISSDIVYALTGHTAERTAHDGYVQRNLNVDDLRDGMQKASREMLKLACPRHHLLKVAAL